MYQLVILVLVVFASPGFAGVCLAAGNTKASGCSAQASEFFRQPVRERERQFATCDFEEQYRLYVYGMRREPPDMDLATVLARRGKNVVGPLKQKLEEASTDLAILNIVLVFQDMASFKTYEVSRDSILADLLKTKVASMKDPNWKELCLKWLQESGIDVGYMPESTGSTKRL